MKIIESKYNWRLFYKNECLFYLDGLHIVVTMEKKILGYLIVVPNMQHTYMHVNDFANKDLKVFSML